MPLQAVARLIQTMLYGRRFFPFYVYIILGGIEEDGTRHRTSRSHTHRPTFFLFPGSGSVYSFDPVGSYERETCRAAGAASSLIQPFLDNQVRAMFRRDHIFSICYALLRDASVIFLPAIFPSFILLPSADRYAIPHYHPIFTLSCPLYSFPI